MLPDGVDDELRGDEAGHDEDPLAGRGGRGEGQDVRARYVTDVDLRGLVRGFWFGGELVGTGELMKESQ